MTSAMKRVMIGIAALLLCSSAFAQDTLRTRFGIVGGNAFNLHTADFRALPGVPNCCPIFGNGSGSGPVAGLTFGTPIAADLLFGIGLNYVTHSALLQDNEPVVIISGGVLESGNLQHSIQATLASIGLEPSLSYRLFSNFFVGLGARVGCLLTKTYTQQEQLTAPSAGTFLNPDGTDSHSRIRNQNSGTLPSAASILLEGIGHLSYQLPLNTGKTLFLEPQLSYAYSFSNVVSGLTWKPNGVIAGIGILYSPPLAPIKLDQYDTVVARDTTTKMVAGKTDTTVVFLARTNTLDSEETESAVLVHATIKEDYRRDIPVPKKLECAMSAVGVDADGNETPIASLKIEEFLSTNAFPLLSFIFFEENSAELQSKFVRLNSSEAKSFHPEKLYGLGTMEIYHDVLNVIGFRMNSYPSATLTLTGCNADMNGEKGDTTLSRRRAQTIKDYFLNIWHLDDSRIRVEWRNLPAKPSNPKTPLGQEENRRTEITCDVPEVLDVFVSYDTTRVSSPPIIRYKLSASAPTGIDHWKLAVTQSSRSLIGFNDQGTPQPSVDWDLKNNQASVPHYGGDVHSDFEVTDGAGKTCEKIIDLPTNIITLRQKKAQNLGDYKIERYSLVLFEFAKSSMTEAQARIIDLIRSNITPKSELTIEGYTDKTGSHQGNAKLATSRANSTRDALARPDAIVRGIGDRRLLYPNDTPEGRFYCRTVQIEVKTPVK